MQGKKKEYLRGKGNREGKRDRRASDKGVGGKGGVQEGQKMG